MKVLLSINPPHVESILSGVKTFEFRRRVFARRDIRTVIVYCTMPVGRIIGEFDISQILEGEPSDIWKRTRQGSGITKEFFDAYFEGRKVAYALEIGDVREYNEPIDPKKSLEKFTPPQSYMYVNDATRNSERLSQLELW